MLDVLSCLRRSSIEHGMTIVLQYCSIALAIVPLSDFHFLAFAPLRPSQKTALLTNLVIGDRERAFAKIQVLESIVFRVPIC